MFSAPDAFPIDLPPFRSTIDIPYTLTPGRAAGIFLAEMANRRIVGARFADGMVIAPAQDFSPVGGEEPVALVEVSHLGTLTDFTRVDGEVIGLIRLDDCANAFPHKILADLASLEVGQRVRAEWGEESAQSIMAIRGFAPVAADLPRVAPKPLDAHADPVTVVPHAMRLDYEHAYGPYYGRMFDEIREHGRVMGVRTSQGDDALLPPREFDDITHRRTGTWKACADTGTIRACSIINMEFIGQTRAPPYVYAEIVLDGASTRLVHMIEIEDIESAKRVIRPGTRVRAVWTKGERKGSLADIERFEVID